MMKVAIENLEIAGYPAFHPKIIGEDGETMEPLFHRYFFVSCAGEQRDFAKINHTRGVQRLMPLHLEIPCRLPDGYLPRLRKALEENAKLSMAEEVVESFRHGQSVLVKCGSYAGVSGTFEKRKKGLLEITFALLGRKHVVCVPQQNVIAITQEDSSTVRGKQFTGRRFRNNSGRAGVPRAA